QGEEGPPPLHLFLPPKPNDVSRKDLLGPAQESPEVTDNAQTGAKDTRFSRQAVRGPRDLPQRMSAEHVILAAILEFHEQRVDVDGALLAMMNEYSVGVHPGLPALHSC